MAKLKSVEEKNMDPLKNFVQNKPKLLKGYKFLFKGLPDEALEDLTGIVLGLGAIVVKEQVYQNPREEDVIYTITCEEYLSEENENNFDVYSYQFILDCIDPKFNNELPDIQTYRFNDKIIETEKNTCTVDSPATNDLSKTKTTKKLNKDQQNYESFVNEPCCSKTLVTNVAKENTNKLDNNTSAVKKKKKETDLENNVENKEDKVNGTAKKSSSKWINTRDFVNEKKELSNSNESSSDDDDDEKNQKKVKNYSVEDEWWENHDIPENQICKIENCDMDPEPHKIHPKRRKFLSMEEKQTLLKYLIQRNKIQEAKGKKIYENMIQDGYLTSRSVETLRNCFRRSILNNLDSFYLPAHIKEELRDMAGILPKGKKKK